MGDESGSRNLNPIDSLYGHRFYVDPQRQPWEPWYAWFPVYVIEWRDPDGSGFPFKVSRLTWLNTIMRRKVVDRVDRLIGSSRSKTYNEYTTVEEMLRNA
jgi:hypothetical protein